MKIECIKEKLAGALQRAERITSKSITLPILSCVLLDAHDSVLVITSTNLDLGIEIKLPVKVLEPGKVAVAGNVLNNFIAGLTNDKNVTLEEEGGNLKVSTKHSHSLIKSFPIDDFPSIPRVSNEVSLNFNVSDFIKGFKSVVYSASVSTLRPALSSVLVSSDADEIIFAATDSFRLAEKKIHIKKHKDFNQILIPFKNVAEIIRAFEGISGEVEVLLSQNQIAFIFEDIYITSRVIDGVFPEYKQLIPKEFKTEVVLLKQDFLNALKVSNIFLDKFSRVSFDVSATKKTFTITTKNMDVGENIQTLDAVIKGEDLMINFSYKYIIDCFQSLETDSISLSFVDSNRPMVISPVSDKSFTYLVMPMNK